MLTRCTCNYAHLRYFVLSSTVSLHVFKRSSFQQFLRMVSSSSFYNQSVCTASVSSTSHSTMYGVCRLFSTSSSPIIQFKLADVGEGVSEVQLVQWYVQAGEPVKQFDKICEVQSDKVNITIVSRYDGIIVKRHHDLNSVVQVGDSLVDIKLERDIAVMTGTKTATIMNEDTIDNISVNKRSNANILVNPAIRQLAREMNISLHQVRGTGKDGRILREDLISFNSEKLQSIKTSVKAAIPPPSPTTVKQITSKPSIPIPSTTTLTKAPDFRQSTFVSNHNKQTKDIRRAIVHKTVHTNSVPHFTYCDEYDMTKLVQFEKQMKTQSNNKQKQNFFFVSFIVKACSQTLFYYPILNAHVDPKCETIIYKGSHNIGIAIDTRDGLVVPNIKNVQQLSISQIEHEVYRLQQLAHAGKLSTEDLTNGTFSLSNLGTIGGTYAVPVLVVPEVVIGALGKIMRKPIPDSNTTDDNDEYCSTNVRSVMSVSWSADHRVIDGATMARFSNQLKFFIENPLQTLVNQ